MPPRRRKRKTRSRKTTKRCPTGCVKKRTTTPRKKSQARVRRGKHLASILPRDERGRFLPLGSADRFRKRRKVGRGSIKRELPANALEFRAIRKRRR